ncbi:DUF5807 family protein [Halobaculum sp. CBA1158]|uniref:DUF5807 family protein n=1 Tax=Halobaculum sp. CBA1158 TaxID=2904243 RepID=UPI001F2DAED8|nr:DUF5807 family protein [Halobaculum sp. CBA1158]UIO99764.1 DUF5807 family protein [Halobaculum sp. CBA1158]
MTDDAADPGTVDDAGEKLAEFLAGERLDDVAIYLTHDHLDEQGKIANMGEAVDGGVVLVVPGDDGRQAFAAGTGMDPMQFAKGAMDRNGVIHPDLGGGECPDAAADPEADHRAEFLFAFGEERNEGVGGLYAEGDVMHAYAHCRCGTDYSHKWVMGEYSEDAVVEE